MKKELIGERRGRPKKFNEEKALEAAMRVFWAKGYDGTSLPDLTKAMGINRPSLYATFGNKEALFQKTMQLYAKSSGALFEESFASATAREGTTRLLKKAVEKFTNPKNPGGCFSSQATNFPGISANLKHMFAYCRGAFLQALQTRFDRAIQERELPGNVSTRNLAEFYVTVYHGLGLQAKGGSMREDLLRVVDIAMDSWPARPSSPRRTVR